MILPILCAIIGTVLIMSPDSVISYDTENKILKTVYDNNQIFGATFFVIAFFTYKKPKPPSYTESIEPTESIDDQLPTYTESEMSQTLNSGER